MNRYWSTVLYADRRLREAQLEYCLIKSYGGNLDFEDGNLDLVVTQPLWRVRAAFPDYIVTARDRIKNRLYERNKLMLKDPTGQRAMLHLHSNAGWHDVCFVPAADILRQSRDLMLDGQPLRLTQRPLEARLYVLHVIFEQLQKNRWDLGLLQPQDFDAFAAEFHLPAAEMAAVRDAPLGPLPWSVLRPICARYRATPQRVTAWNRFLHGGFTWLQAHRRRQNRSRENTP